MSTAFIECRRDGRTENVGPFESEQAAVAYAQARQKQRLGDGADWFAPGCWIVKPMVAPFSKLAARTAREARQSSS